MAQIKSSKPQIAHRATSTMVHIAHQYHYPLWYRHTPFHNLFCLWKSSMVCILYNININNQYCSSVSLIELLWQLCWGPDLIWETFCNKKASVVRKQLLPTGIVVSFVKKSLFLKSIDQQKSTTSSGQIQIINKSLLLWFFGLSKSTTKLMQQFCIWFQY